MESQMAMWEADTLLLPVIDQSLMLECNGSSFFRWYLLVPGLQKYAVSFISLSVAPWLKQRNWSSFMITLYNIFVVQVKGVQGGLRVCNTSWGELFALYPLACTAHPQPVLHTSASTAHLQPVLHTFSLYCTPQPVLHTFSLYCTPSACTTHTIYWVIIIVFNGMPSLDTSSMRNKIVCSMEYITGYCKQNRK